jgi:autotransporter-associated beta strand protein
MQAPRQYLLFVLSLLCTWLALPESLHAQRQMETLGRGLVAMRPDATRVYVGWRVLGDDPSDIGFNVYRSIGGAAAVKLNASVLTSSTNYLDTPPSNAFTSTTTYHVVPVINGVEQTASSPVTLSVTSYQTFLRLQLATPYPNPAAPTTPYDVKFCWVGDFDGDGEYDFLVDRVPTAASLNQYLEAYRRDGTFLWRMDMGPNSTAQSNLYEPGSSVISIGDTDNVTVYDLDGDGRAEVAVRTSNGVTVTNAAGQTVAAVTAGNNTTQFVSVIDGLSGAELGRVTLPNPWAQHGTLTNKCAIAYLDGIRPSVIFYGYNRADSGSFYRVFSAFDYRGGVLSQRWSTPQTFNGAEGHQIRIADVDNDGKDEICDIGHVIDDDGTQLFVIDEISHGDRFHVADINPDRPGLENYIIQQNNPSFLATAFYDAGTGQMIKKWYATDVVDVGRGIAQDLNSTHKGYEMYSTQGGIYNAKGEQIYANNVWAPEGLWWDTDLLREFIDGAGNGALNPVINKFNQTSGGTDRVWTLYNDFGNYSTSQAYGGRPAFWGDILGDWREELVLVTSDYTALRIYTPTSVATNRLYTLMHNPAYRTQATTKGYVQSSNVDYYLGVGMTTPPPPPMVKATLSWSPGSGASTWDSASTAAWKNTSTGVTSTFAAGASVRFDLSGSNASPVALSGVLQPGAVTVYSPFDYTLDGSAGSLAGSMKLVKSGKGSLRITGSHTFTGSSTVWDGALRIDGALTGSAVTVWGGTWGGALAKGLSGGRLSGSGSISQPVSLQYRGALTPGAGMNAAGTLSLGSGLSAADGSVLAFDLSTDPSGNTLANDRIAITGNLALSGSVALVINPLSGQLAPGAYTLATYTGSLTGSASNLSVLVPDGTPYNLSPPPGPAPSMEPGISPIPPTGASPALPTSLSPATPSPLTTPAPPVPPSR